MLRWHRLFAISFLPVMLYIVFTGAGIQFWDMVALVGKAPETSADMRQMRAHIYGAPNYAVISASDYDAPALPVGTDYLAGLQRTAMLARAAVPGGALRLVELRSYHGRVIGHAQMNDQQLAFDLARNSPLGADALPLPQPGFDLYAPRFAFKQWHRLWLLGNWGAALNGIAGLGLAAMMITGLVQYWRVYRARLRASRTSPFWGRAMSWRTLHRTTSLLATLPMLWLVVSGLALAIDNTLPAIEGTAPGPPKPGAGPDAFMGDFSKPMRDAELPTMAAATLAAFHRERPGVGIKTLRLRYFAGYAQGVVIAADGDTSQMVYNTATGGRMSMDEPGYPKLMYPEGWEWHQRLKRMHRGDFLGMPGRWLISIAALALLYLLVSGTVMYFQMYLRRRSNGRKMLIWR